MKIHLRTIGLRRVFRHAACLNNIAGFHRPYTLFFPKGKPLILAPKERVSPVLKGKGMTLHTTGGPTKKIFKIASSQQLSKNRTGECKSPFTSGSWFSRWYREKFFGKQFEETLSQVKAENTDAINLVWSAGTYITYGAVGLAILGTFGVDTSPIVGGLGVTGAAIGFAAKDLINNLLCGFSLIFYGRIRRGEAVVLAGHSGVVEKIELSRVILRAENGDTIVIPSAKIASDIVVIRSTEKKEN